MKTKSLILLGFSAGLLWLWIYPVLIGGNSFTAFDTEFAVSRVERAGFLGPVMVVVLMAVAVVASPLPSAPIALAAGAVYGHFTGTFLVALGSELGAMLAFLIARYLGRDVVRRLLGPNSDVGLLGSQNALTLIVFTSRLLPFVSFDAISYAAGFSQLHLWRFLIATLAGILPASFLLAHFGAKAMAGNFGVTEWLAIGLGLLTAIPLVLVALTRTRSGREPEEP